MDFHGIFSSYHRTGNGGKDLQRDFSFLEWDQPYFESGPSGGGGGTGNPGAGTSIGAGIAPMITGGGGGKNQSWILWIKFAFGWFRFGSFSRAREAMTIPVPRPSRVTRSAAASPAIKA